MNHEAQHHVCGCVTVTATLYHESRAGSHRFFVPCGAARLTGFGCVWVWAPGDERALLGILEWTGLRKEAVASLGICDVWSDESNDVRDVVTAIEKFSRRHSLSMPAPLREVLRLYLTGPESPRLAQTLDPLLFPHHRGVFNRPSPSFVATKRLLEKGRRERERGGEGKGKVLAFE